MRGVFHVPGEAEGSVLKLAAPLSFWGGVEAESGMIIDRSQPHFRAQLRGKVLVMPSGRGSSSSSSVLAETIRNESGPVAIVLERADPIITAGAMVARSLYGIVCPVVVCPIEAIRDGETVRITEDEGGALVELR